MSTTGVVEASLFSACTLDSGRLCYCMLCHAMSCYAMLQDSKERQLVSLGFIGSQSLNSYHGNCFADGCYLHAHFVSVCSLIMLHGRYQQLGFWDCVYGWWLIVWCLGGGRWEVVGVVGEWCGIYGFSLLPGFECFWKGNKGLAMYWLCRIRLCTFEGC